MHMGLPWWSSAWEYTCQCGGHGFDLWSGKIPRAMEQLNLRTTTNEARRPRACALQREEPPGWDAWAPQLEKPVRGNEDPVRPKNKK